MKMEKKKFRIGDLAHKLGVERFVIRFWEKEFGLAATRSTGGQRFYTEDDYNTFVQIKQLLYKEKFTIQGAKKKLQSGGAQLTTMDDEPIKHEATEMPVSPEKLVKQITMLKKQLMKLRELL